MQSRRDAEVSSPTSTHTHVSRVQPLTQEVFDGEQLLDDGTVLLSTVTGLGTNLDELFRSDADL